jgi:hypothetical protein
MQASKKIQIILSWLFTDLSTFIPSWKLLVYNYQVQEIDSPEASGKCWNIICSTILYESSFSSRKQRSTSRCSVYSGRSRSYTKSLYRQTLEQLLHIHFPSPSLSLRCRYQRQSLSIWVECRGRYDNATSAVVYTSRVFWHTFLLALIPILIAFIIHFYPQYIICLFLLLPYDSTFLAPIE